MAIVKLRKGTVYYRKTCIEQPFLHPDLCFESYHTKIDVAEYVLLGQILL